jgi:hypothetical protein
MNLMRTAASTLFAALLLAAPAFGHVDGARLHLHNEGGVVEAPMHLLGVVVLLLAAALLRRHSRRSIRQS